MKYIRTKENNIVACEDKDLLACLIAFETNKQADTIEELIEIGDIVFYWQQSDDKEHCCLMVYDTDLCTIKHCPITKLLIPVGENYVCVAKGYPSFNLIKGRRYLVNKGKLELQ